MKKLLLATTAAIALNAGPATAADIAVKSAPVGRTCAAAQFGGAHVGISGGGVHWQANRSDLDEVLVDVNTIVQKTWAGIVGAEVGYSWTTCSTLWGVVVDGSWLSGDQTTTLIPNRTDTPPFINSKWDALVTARARTGVALDNVLLYVTGGVAAGHFKTQFVDPTDGFASFNNWRWGWVAGFGTEWAWTPKITVKFETLYVDFIDRNYTAVFSTAPTQSASFTLSDSAWISRIGINWRW
jgi:outer membrane immunogenic protein